MSRPSRYVLIRLTHVRNAFFLGAPFNVIIFSLPQRFQIVNSTSPLGAGIRLLPFTCATPVGSIVSSMVAGKMKIPPIYLVVTASCLQIVGFSLLSTLPVVKYIPRAQYGYEVIAGFGVGINISTLVLMTPASVQKRDQGSFIQYTRTQTSLTYCLSGCFRIYSAIPLSGSSHRPRSGHERTRRLCPL